MESDHAMLHVTGCTQDKSPEQNQETDLGFVVDPEKGEIWSKVFKDRSRPFPFQNTPTKAEIEEEAESLMADIQKTNEEIFRKHRPPNPKASPWWNATCAIAAQNLRNTQTPDE